MEEGRPLLAILERRPLAGALFGQEKKGPIIGAILRMRPDARGAFIRDMAIDTFTWAIGLGAGRVLMRIIDMNLAQFLGKAAEWGAS